MPLNTTQRQTIRDVLKLYVDDLLERDLNEWLKKIIAPIDMTQDVALRILKSNRNLVGDIYSSVFIPANIRNYWGEFAQALHHGQAISESVYQELLKSPNYNPIYIASMKQFEDSLSDLNEIAKKEIIALRELYLEMTPIHKYRYREDYPPFHFRIGNVPFNLNNYGSIPIQGEIQSDVEAYIGERIELEESKLEAIAKLQQKTTQLQEKTTQLEEQKKRLEEQRVHLDYELHKTYQIASSVISGHNSGLISAHSDNSAPSSASASSSTTLFMHKQKLSDKDIHFVVQTLKRNESFDRIELQNNAIGAEGANILFSELVKLPQIKAVNLWANKLKDAGMDSIAAFLPNLSIIDLILNQNMITHKGMAQFASALESNHSITHLDLGYNDINDSGISTLAHHLLPRNHTSLTLKLGGNQIGLEGAKALLHLVKRNPSIINIELNGNDKIPLAFIEAIESICEENLRNHVEANQQDSYYSLASF